MGGVNRRTVVLAWAKTEDPVSKIAKVAQVVEHCLKKNLKIMVIVH
jgi:hypothetical protein